MSFRGTKCKVCKRRFHWCYNCGYDKELHPLAYGYCSYECLRKDDGPEWEEEDDDLDDNYPL